VIVYFSEKDGSTPLLVWLNDLPEKARFKCLGRLRLLAHERHQLRRPAADYPRDGIYELRARESRVQYRMLHFFHGHFSIVVSHGFTKREAAVPPTEIERALRRKIAFESDPPGHTYGRPNG